MEAEPEKFEAEQDIAIEQLKPRQGRRKQLQGWFPPLLIGTGLGIAIAIAGTKLLSRPVPNQNLTQSSPAQAPSMSVTVAPVESTRVVRALNVTGSVAARGDLIPVLPQTTGLQIEQILVGEGDTVKAGQVMATLNNSVLQAQLDQAQAQLQSAQAVVRQRQAARAQAQANLVEAQQELRRYQSLANAGAISRQELDVRATNAATAQESVRVADANIISAQADVRNNAAKVKQLSTQLGQTTVRAPVSGVVAEKIARIGDIANSTQRLFSIIQNGLLEVQAQVPATQLPQVRIGASAQITSDNDSRVRLQGIVREIAPLVNQENRQATVKINLPPTSLLRPGLFVRAAITTSNTTSLTVPAQAVVSPATGGSTVFLLGENDTVRAQPVEVGEIVNGDRVEIKQGLKLGDRIVVAGAGYLKDGDRVQVVSSLR